MRGGDGRDYVGAGKGRDIVEGGTGADGLYGSKENDRLYGENQGEAADLIAAGATQQASDKQGDWVDAEDGDDQVFTGAGNDLIAGGAGNDLIVSGGGSDWIWGDWNSISEGDKWKDWSVTEKATPGAAGNTTYTYDVANIGTESRNGVGNDIIYAGAGNDMVDGEAGNDTIYLEDGKDKGWGGAGNDVMLGGSGDDQIYGDSTIGLLPENQHGDDFLDGGKNVYPSRIAANDDVYRFVAGAS